MLLVMWARVGKNPRYVPLPKISNFKILFEICMKIIQILTATFRILNWSAFWLEDLKTEINIGGKTCIFVYSAVLNQQIEWL